MRIGLTAPIKLLPDRNVRFQGYSRLRQGATRAAISSQNEKLEDHLILARCVCGLLARSAIVVSNNIYYPPARKSDWTMISVRFL